MDPNLARDMRAATEPFHAFVYFLPEVLEAYAAVGLTHPRRAYFAPRSAPMGEVSAGTVAAAFYNFNPVKVAEHIPAAWVIIGADDLVQLRLASVGAQLPGVLGEALDRAAVSEALVLARAAVECCGFEGRVLAGAHAGVPEPDDELTALWHLVSVLREHRGDGHLMALQAHDLDGVECLLYRRPAPSAAEVYRRSRGWAESDFEDARARLAQRGLITGTEATEKAVALRESVEKMTDQLAIGPWRRIGQERAERFRELMQPLSHAAKRVVDASMIGQTMLSR